MSGGPYTDAEGTVRLWVNSRDDLVNGENAPVMKGAHFARLRSPFKGAYVVLTRLGGVTALSPEVPVDRARIGAVVYGVSKQTASIGATAYANAVESLRGDPVTINGVKILFTANMIGPLDITMFDKEPRYSVDADFYIQQGG
jgi:hypothetical protein